jgi:hypothetical protein
VTWSIDKDALAPITWDNYEFVQGGYDPTTGTVHDLRGPSGSMAAQ